MISMLDFKNHWLKYNNVFQFRSANIYTSILFFKHVLTFLFGLVLFVYIFWQNIKYMSGKII